MNVWIVNQYAVPPDQTGVTRHFSLARELIRLGHEAVIVAASFNHFARTDARLAAGEREKLEPVQGVPFFWLQTPPYEGNTAARVRNMVEFSLSAWRKADVGRFGRPDVVIGSSPHLFAAFAAERLAAKHGVPFVMEVRDIWPKTLVDVGNISPFHPFVLLLAVLERYLYKRASLIVSLLPGAIEHFAEKGGDRSKFLWLPNGIDLSLVPAPAPPPDDGVFKLTYAGSHGIANALEPLIDAAAILQAEGYAGRIMIQMIGEGPEKARIQARAQELGLSNIRFDAPVPKAQIYDVLARADAFTILMPPRDLYRYGVSPNKIFDYMACGRPILFGGDVMKNPIADAGAGVIVSAEDPRAIAEAIKSLAAMPLAEREAMGRRGRRHVEDHYAFEILGRRLADALTALKDGAQ